MTRIGHTQTLWNITLTLNTDGVSIWKHREVVHFGQYTLSWMSSHLNLGRVCSILVYLPLVSQYICLLCSVYRYSLKYFILYALWFQPGKSPIQAFLDPLIKQIGVLSSEGMNFVTVLKLVVFLTYYVWAM